MQGAKELLSGNHGSTSRSHSRSEAKDVSDAELVRRWQSGSVDAGAALLRRHEPSLRRFFQLRFGQGSEDLIQQTLLVCTKNVTRINDADKFPSFLLGVARRVSLEHIRKKRIRAKRDVALAHEPETVEETPSGVTCRRECGGHLARAVKTLPPQWQLAVVMHYWHGLSVAEVASLQEVAEGTVKSWLARSRAQLRRKLSLLLPEPQG